jgi:glycerol-3-phosphate acyltransferase PlsY
MAAQDPATLVFWMLAAFGLGSIPFGLISSRWIGGVDPRAQGSGNIGFTNVLRVSNRLAAAATLVGDVGKGALAAWLMRHRLGAGMDLQLAAGLAAVIGHMFTPFLRFKGGKGVATAFGMLFVAIPVAGAITLAIWGVVLVASSYVSLASLVAFSLLPFTVVFFAASWLTIVLSGLLAILIIVRHRENIARLLGGVEHSIRRQTRPDGPI